ncbi:REST corepressor 3-like isoform X2 [Styela clava]
MATIVSTATDTRTSPVIYETMNGQVYEESSDEEPEVRMRVGEMYQARVPKWEAEEKVEVGTHDGIKIWSPFHDVPDEKVEAYCKIAKEKHGYNAEQALGLLFWHKHDIEKSLKDMSNFTPMPDDWSDEDKVLFEQAYTFHGKSFRRIQQLLPDKEICQLVKFYYLWKKTRTKTSLMDRQARKLSKQSNGSDDSDGESNHLTYMQSKSQHDIKMLQGKSEDGKGDIEIKHKLPKGINLEEKGLSEISSFPGGPEKYLKKLENSITMLKSQIQVDKQHWSLLCQELKGISQFEDFITTPIKEDSELSPVWSNQELLLAVQGVRRYGKDFQAISEVLESKTAAQVKTFFVSQRRRYNLDQVLREYEEAEAGNKDKIQENGFTEDVTQTDSVMDI